MTEAQFRDVKLYADELDREADALIRNASELRSRAAVLRMEALDAAQQEPWWGEAND